MHVIPYLPFQLISYSHFSASLTIIILPNNSTHLFYIPLTCTYPLTCHFTFLHTLLKKDFFISSFHVNTFEILIHVHRKSSQKRGKEKRKNDEEKERKKKERNKRKRKKENKFGIMHYILPSHLYHFHLSLSSIIIHIIWEYNYHKWYQSLF